MVPAIIRQHFKMMEVQSDDELCRLIIQKLTAALKPHSGRPPSPEQQLFALEKSCQRFYLAVSNIVADEQVPEQIRLAALVLIKRLIGLNPARTAKKFDFKQYYFQFLKVHRSKALRLQAVEIAALAVSNCQPGKSFSALFELALSYDRQAQWVSIWHLLTRAIKVYIERKPQLSKVQLAKMYRKYSRGMLEIFERAVSKLGQSFEEGLQPMQAQLALVDRIMRVVNALTRHLDGQLLITFGAACKIVSTLEKWGYLNCNLVKRLFKFIIIMAEQNKLSQSECVLCVKAAQKISETIWPKAAYLSMSVFYFSLKGIIALSQDQQPACIELADAAYLTNLIHSAIRLIDEGNTIEDRCIEILQMCLERFDPQAIWNILYLKLKGIFDIATSPSQLESKIKGYRLVKGIYRKLKHQFDFHQLYFNVLANELEGKYPVQLKLEVVGLITQFIRNDYCSLQLAANIVKAMLELIALSHSMQLRLECMGTLTALTVRTVHRTFLGQLSAKFAVSLRDSDQTYAVSFLTKFCQIVQHLNDNQLAAELPSLMEVVNFLIKSTLLNVGVAKWTTDILRNCIRKSLSKQMPLILNYAIVLMKVNSLRQQTFVEAILHLLLAFFKEINSLEQPAPAIDRQSLEATLFFYKELCWYSEKFQLIAVQFLEQFLVYIHNKRDDNLLRKVCEGFQHISNAFFYESPISPFFDVVELFGALFPEAAQPHLRFIIQNYVVGSQNFQQLWEVYIRLMFRLDISSYKKMWIFTQTNLIRFQPVLIKILLKQLEKLTQRQNPFSRLTLEQRAEDEFQLLVKDLESVDICCKKEERLVKELKNCMYRYHINRRLIQNLNFYSWMRRDKPRSASLQRILAADVQQFRWQIIHDQAHAIQGFGSLYQ